MSGIAHNVHNRLDHNQNQIIDARTQKDFLNMENTNYGIRGGNIFLS